MIFKKPTVFLSYRRTQSAILARSLHTRLAALGVDAFLDVEDINGGRFDNIIEQEIVARDNFLVLLSPETLQSEWVRKEIALALQHEKFIIPVTMDGFNFAQLQDYPEIAALARESGIPYDFQYDHAAFARIVQALSLDRHRRNRRLLAGLIGIILLFSVMILFFSFRVQDSVVNTATNLPPPITEAAATVPSDTSAPVTTAVPSISTEPVVNLTATFQVQFQTAAALVTASVSP